MPEVGPWYDAMLSRFASSGFPWSRRLATMPAGPVSRPWRRYLRISMRGLILLVLVIGACLGWVTRCGRIQREAVDAIWSARRGSVLYDWQCKQGRSRIGSLLGILKSKARRALKRRTPNGRAKSR